MVNTLEYLSKTTLAGLLDISEQELARLSANTPKMYSEFTLVKAGKTRIIEMPSPLLKRTQKAFATKVLYQLRVNSRLYGCPGTSIKDAVADHVNKPVVITLDIKDFFPSVKRYQIRRMLKRRKASSDVVDTLVRLTTYKNHLPHGSPSSPCIARLILNPLADHMERLLRSIHPDTIFSIYVDDITISGPEGIIRAIPTIKALVERHGFKINPQKIKVMKKDEEQESLNIRLNKRIEPTISYLKKVETIRDQYSADNQRFKGMQAFVDFLFRT